MKLFSIFIFVIVLAIAFGSTNNIGESDRPRRICGSRLTRALSIMCHSQYNKKFDPTVWKEMTQDKHDDDNMYLDSGYGAWNPLVGSGHAMLPRMAFGRTRRGVADECCARYNGCTLDELRSYCYYDDPDTIPIPSK